MDNQKRIEPTGAGIILQNEQDNYMKLAHACSQLEAQLSNAQAEIESLKQERTMSGIHGQCMMEESDNEIVLLRRERDEALIKNRKLSNIVSVLNCGMQTMVFTPNELAGHECLAKHKLLSLFDYWRKKVAPAMRALVNGNEDSQVEKLETELAEARAEIEKFNNLFASGIECFMTPCEKHAGENTPPFDEFMEKYGRKCVPCLVDEIERKDKLIEQMREALRAWTRTPNIPLHEAIKITNAALEAVERIHTRAE